MRRSHRLVRGAWLALLAGLPFGCGSSEPGVTVSSADPLRCPEGALVQRVDFPDDRGGGFAERCVLPDGTRHGPSREWYASGQRRAQTEWQRGMRHGKSVFWYRNGRKMAEVQHDHWQAVGVWTNWDAEGQVVDQKDFGSAPQVGAAAADATSRSPSEGAAAPRPDAPEGLPPSSTGDSGSR
jgi:hypothetical protein